MYNHLPPPPDKTVMKSGFTLIEMSIVLVIIGLIVGGILMGQDLISAAAVRAQISQIEKYNTAVHTFQGKYGYLPGDIPDPYATNFGFQSRGALAGEGDGNGVLEGNCAGGPGNTGVQQGDGELAVFWQDLTTAGLLDSYIGVGACLPSTSSCGCTNYAKWLPPAKLGQGNYVYVYSLNGINYFDVQLVRHIGAAIESTGVPGAGANTMTVQQAYNIDKKMDDGLPQSGSVTACDNDYDVTSSETIVWAAGNSQQGAGGANCAPTIAATPYATTNCFDNATLAVPAGVVGTETYSLTQNANLQNCALSFKFQ